jgi:hypothetical protein
MGYLWRRADLMTVGRGQQLLLGQGVGPVVAGLTLDGTATAIGVTASALSVTGITTTKTNDLLVLVTAVSSASSGAAPTVSSIATSGLTWTKRKAQTITISGGGYNGYSLNLEEWTAPASAIQSNVTAAITYSSAISGGAAALVFAVNGCASITSPFDPNASVPASANNPSVSTGAQESANIATTDSPGFVFCVEANMQNQFPSPGSGMTQLHAYVSEVGGTGLGPILSSEYKATAAPMGSTAITFGASTDLIWAAIWDALH